MDQVSKDKDLSPKAAVYSTLNFTLSYSGSTCGVVTQNSNGENFFDLNRCVRCYFYAGPCPLIAIINVLSLRKKLSLPHGCEVSKN